jgi:hypothetical protein
MGRLPVCNFLLTVGNILFANWQLKWPKMGCFWGFLAIFGGFDSFLNFSVADRQPT